MSIRKRLIIIGGGIAGLTAASSARRQWPGAQIAVVEADPHLAYNKIALGAFAAGKSPRDRLRLLPPLSLERQRIETVANARVRELAAQERKIVLDDGRRLAYDTLVLATGARPIVPPIEGIDAPGVLPLWSMSDALLARERLKEARSVTVVGGGVLGVEMAAAFREAGRDVTIAEAQGELLPRLLDETAGALYTGALRAAGIELSLGDPVAAITRTLLGLEVRTAGGAVFASDMVLVTAGVRPQIELAQEAGLACRKGIVVNRFLRTSAPDILACGNCIELEGRLQPLWNPALEQGSVAGSNAFGDTLTYASAPPILHVKTPRTPLFVCGERPGEGAKTALEQRTKSTYRAAVLDDEKRVTYAVFVGDTARAQLLERAVISGAPMPAGPVASGDLEALLDALDDDTQDDRRAWSCRVCGYVHEGGAPPQVCPVCAVGPDQFLAA